MLIGYVRGGQLTFDEALSHMQDGEILMRGNEFEVTSSQVLALAHDSGCSSYDCEFVAAARHFGVPLVTSDEEVLAKFKPVAVSM